MYHKCQSYHVWFLRYGAWRTNFFIILDLFLPFYPTNNNPENQNFKKIKKYSWRYYHFTNVPPKNPKKLNFLKKVLWDINLHMCTIQSHDVWFLRYGARQTEFFVILDRFLPYCPPNNPKIQNFEKMKKKGLQIPSFYKCVPKIMIICLTVPEIQNVPDVIFFFILGYFLPF